MKSNAFYARDNVCQFLFHCRNDFGIADGEIFTDADLVDAKNDRRVVSCLLGLARRAGVMRKGPVPKIVQYEIEIEEQQQKVSATMTELDLTEVVLSEFIDEEESRRETLLREQDLRFFEMCDWFIVQNTEITFRAKISAIERQQRVQLVRTGKEEIKQRLSKSKFDRALLALGEEEVALREDIGEAEERFRSALWKMHEEARKHIQSEEVHAAAREAMQKREEAVIAQKGHKIRRGRNAKDDVDVGAAKVVQEARAGWHLTPINVPGQFVLWHPDSSSKAVLFLRLLQNVVMIRVGGGWESFVDYLGRKKVEWDGIKYTERLNKRPSQIGI